MRWQFADSKKQTAGPWPGHMAEMLRWTQTVGAEGKWHRETQFMSRKMQSSEWLKLPEFVCVAIFKALCAKHSFLKNPNDAAKWESVWCIFMHFHN